MIYSSANHHKSMNTRNINPKIHIKFNEYLLLLNEAFSLKELRSKLIYLIKQAGQIVNFLMAFRVSAVEEGASSLVLRQVYLATSHLSSRICCCFQHTSRESIVPRLKSVSTLARKTPSSLIKIVKQYSPLEYTMGSRVDKTKNCVFQFKSIIASQ